MSATISIRTLSHKYREAKLPVLQYDVHGSLNCVYPSPFHDISVGLQDSPL